VLDFLVDDPILIVFIIIGIGAGVGSLRYRGFSIGPAAALFVGLAIGAIDETVSGVNGPGFFKEPGLAGAKHGLKLLGRLEEEVPLRLMNVTPPAGSVSPHT